MSNPQNPKNFEEFFKLNLESYLQKSIGKYTCIEDQFYQVDRFPRYSVDNDIVFVCNDCNKMVEANSLRQCDLCEANFCDINHTSHSICKDLHECASRNMISFENMTYSGLKTCEYCNICYVKTQKLQSTTFDRRTYLFKK